MSAGKGDKLRKGADLNKYWSNYDAIFGKKKKLPLEVGDGLPFVEMNISLGKSPELKAATDLLRRCRDSAGRMDLDLYQDIQEFLHQNS